MLGMAWTGGFGFELSASAPPTRTTGAIQDWDWDWDSNIRDSISTRSSMVYQMAASTILHTTRRSLSSAREFNSWLVVLAFFFASFIRSKHFSIGSTQLPSNLKRLETTQCKPKNKTKQKKNTQKEHHHSPLGEYTNTNVSGNGLLGNHHLCAVVNANG